MAGQGGTPAAEIEAWVGRHPGWTYAVSPGGRHVILDPRDHVVANNPDPAEALRLAKGWA